MVKKYIFLFLIIFSIPIFAQEESGENQSEEYYDEESEEEESQEFNFKKTILMGFNFQLGIPQGQFGENVDYVGWGFGGDIMWQFKKSLPLYGGIDFGIQNLDFEARYDINGFGEEFETRTKNKIILSHFLIRFYPEVNFWIQPYFEGAVGMKSLFTRTIITDRTGGINETINSQFDQSDFTLNLGGAVGFEIPIRKEYLFFEAKCSFYKGFSAEYYARRDDFQGSLIPIDAFELKRSNTDFIVPLIGFKFLIGFGNTNEEEYYEEEEYYDEY